MSLCVTAAGKTVVLAASLFTLSWTHSVERQRWEEDWRVTPAGLQLIAARVKGSGAGMEPGDDAVLRDEWWAWTVTRAPQPSLVLAASGDTPGGWRLCAGDDCIELGEAAGDPAVLTACDRPPQ